MAAAILILVILWLKGPTPISLAVVQLVMLGEGMSVVGRKVSYKTTANPRDRTLPVGHGCSFIRSTE